MFLLLVGMGTVGLRTLLAKQQVLESSTAVHETGYVQIGGASQWIEIGVGTGRTRRSCGCTADQAAPVLPASYASFLPWEKVFTHSSAAMSPAPHAGLAQVRRHVRRQTQRQDTSAGRAPLPQRLAQATVPQRSSASASRSPRSAILFQGASAL